MRPDLLSISSKEIMMDPRMRHKLILQGYCRVSNRYGIISRIDRPDWKDSMAINHAPWSKEQGMKWVESMSLVDAEDYYRRCISIDTKELGHSMGMKFPQSAETKTGFVEIEAGSSAADDYLDFINERF
jgi:hypothetical protein